MESDLWKDDANCKNVDTNVFFPNDMGQINPEKMTEALLYCNNCSVSEQCLEYAINSNIQVGIWGGMSTRARRQIAAERRKVMRSNTQHGTMAMFSREYSAFRKGDGPEPCNQCQIANRSYRAAQSRRIRANKIAV